MRLALLFLLSVVAVAHGFPSNLPSISSSEEHGVENQPDIRHPIVPTCVSVNDHDEKLRSITARAPRRGAKGAVASSPSRTSINKPPSPPSTSPHPPSSPAQDQLPTGTQARSQLTTVIYTTSVTVGNSALGVVSPSVTEPPRAATTIPGSNHRRVSPKTIIIVVVVVIIVILILIVAIIAGVLLWRKKRARKGQRDGVLPKYHSVSCKEWSEGW